jgi:hypothetical protein
MLIVGKRLWIGLGLLAAGFSAGGGRQAAAARAGRRPTGRAAAPAGMSSEREEFEALYRKYTDLYFARTMPKADELSPEAIDEQARLAWREVFKARDGLVRARVQEILAELPDARPFGRDDSEVIWETTVEAPDGAPAAEAVVHRNWNPVNVAAEFAAQGLSAFMWPPAFERFKALQGHVSAVSGWEAVDRDVDAPKLLLRRGPLAVTVHLRAKGIVYWPVRGSARRLKAAPPAPMLMPYGQAATYLIERKKLAPREVVEVLLRSGKIQPEQAMSMLAEAGEITQDQAAKWLVSRIAGVVWTGQMTEEQAVDALVKRGMEPETARKALREALEAAEAATKRPPEPPGDGPGAGSAGPEGTGDPGASQTPPSGGPDPESE